MEHGELVEGWINQLGAGADPATSDALEQLEKLPALRHWASTLRHARATQQITMRDTHFTHPTPAVVTTTLNKGRPANATDVAAIVNELLDEIAEDVLASDLNIYKLFWNSDSSGKTSTPKPENVCRDALATLLRERLKKYSIICEAEGNHAKQKRSDVWCTCDTFGVPVEAKVDKHRDIWKALNEQLITKYSIDPRAQGLGIYVVFWFGRSDEMAKQAGEAKLTSVIDLKARLENQIDSKHRKLISVHVIDCSAK